MFCCPDSEDRVQAQAQSDHLWLSKRKEFQRNTQERVKSLATTWLCLNYTLRGGR
jgi:hypothetical protein